MNGILNGADFPKEWKESREKLLHKGRRTDELKNYRPIAIINVTCTLCMLMVRGRIDKWTEDSGMLGEIQGGFRRGRRTEDNLFMLERLIEMVKGRKEEIFVAFLDMEKAYDRVNRKKHTLNNTVAKGFNQMAPPARTITVALDMSKAFDTINIHTLIRKLLQTNIPGTIIRFIANYIKGRKAYTTYRNHTSKQRQFKTGVPQGGVLSPTLFNIYTSAKKYIQPYLHKVFAWTKQQPLTKSRQNNLHSVHTRPYRIYEQSGPNNKQQSTTHGNAPKGSGSYLRPKTHIQHTHPQHLSTSTQTSTNHKSTLCNRMG